MKLLLDQNLSYRLLDKIESVYPGSTQVRLLGLEQADDMTIWRFARDNGYTIVTMDSDFHELSLLHGEPPKVIWLKCGNRPKWYVFGLLINNQDRIRDFHDEHESSCLEIYS